MYMQTTLPHISQPSSSLIRTHPLKKPPPTLLRGHQGSWRVVQLAGLSIAKPRAFSMAPHKMSAASSPDGASDLTIVTWSSGLLFLLRRHDASTRFPSSDQHSQTLCGLLTNLIGDQALVIHEEGVDHGIGGLEGGFSLDRTFALGAPGDESLELLILEKQPKSGVHLSARVN